MGSSFIILISNYVSSDGLVAWKSTKLGANFYTPNIFAKNVKELGPKILDEDRNVKYPLDILLISSISIDDLQENCRLLSKYVDERTIVLISADFGCELEKIAIRAMGDRCKCVLSVACDVECRQLSLGSYALVNDDNCEMYLGNSYCTSSGTRDSIFNNNIEKARKELNGGEDSSIGQMVRQLEATQWIKVEPLKDTKQMALKLWQLIIPKISLNILSIIYEQFDYEKMLENKSTEMIFRGLVRELLDICSAQCNSKVEVFSKKNTETDEIEIDFARIVEHCKRKRNQLLSTTANEYPEYLFLPFELYCFYHRFEYPAQILLYQPILLAEEYHVSCSNLNFLYGFYSRLLSLSGLSINGGRSEQDLSHLTQTVEGSVEHSTTRKCKCKSKSKIKLKEVNLKSKLGFKVTGSKARQGRGIFSIASPAGTDYAMPSSAGQQDCQAPDCVNGPGCDSTLPSDDDAECSDSECEGEPRIDVNELRCHCGAFDPMRASKKSRMGQFELNSDHDHASAESGKQMNRNGSQTTLDDMSATTLPHFSKKYSTKSLTSMSWALTKNSRTSLAQSSRPHSTSSLEMQLRSDRRLANDYQDIYGQFLDTKDGPMDQKSYNDRRKQYVQLEKQLWHFQRQYNILNGTIANPRLGPYRDLLTHMEVLCGEHNSDIIRFTTSRYGDLDLYTSIERDKDHILALFKRGSEVNRDNDFKNGRDRITGEETSSDKAVRLQRSS